MAELKKSFSGRLIKKEDRDVAEKAGVGAFYFSRNKMNLWAVMPDRDGNGHWMRFNIGNENEKPYWTWDGDEQKPTLYPSLWWQGEWHGHLTKGEFITVK